MQSICIVESVFACVGIEKILSSQYQHMQMCLHCFNINYFTVVQPTKTTPANVENDLEIKDEPILDSNPFSSVSIGVYFLFLN